MCIFCLICNYYNILRGFKQQLSTKWICFRNQAEMVLFRCSPYKKVVSISGGQVCEALASIPHLIPMSTGDISWGDNGCRCVRLTALPFRVPVVYKFCEASTSWNPQGLSRPVQGLLYLLVHLNWQHVVKMATRRHNSLCVFRKLNFVTETRTANCRDQYSSRNVVNCI